MLTGKSFFWDSCVFIDSITGKQRDQDAYQKLIAFERYVSSGNGTIFTSTMTMIEVLEYHLTPEQALKFKGLLANPDVPFVGLDTRVAELAREIRNEYQAIGLKIKVPDCIQLATAIHLGAVALHTYDGYGPGSKATDLLRLPLPILGKHHIDICIPQIPEELAEPEPPIQAQAQIAAAALPLFPENQENDDPIVDEENAQE